MTHVFQAQHVRHFLRLVIPPQTNNSSNISVFNRWVPVGACPKCSQIVDISRSLADHDVFEAERAGFMGKVLGIWIYVNLKALRL